MQFRDGARLGAQATRRRDAQARERRPLVGTARRRRANGAVLLSQVVQTRPRITPQIRKVQGRAIRAADEAPIAALSGRGADRKSAFQAVPALFRGRRYCGPPRYAGLCRSEDRRSLPSGTIEPSSSPRTAAVSGRGADRRSAAPDRRHPDGWRTRGTCIYTAIGPGVFRPKRNDERREAARFGRDASPAECRITLSTGC